MIVEILFYIFIQVVSFLTKWLPGAGDVPLKLPWGVDSLMMKSVVTYKVIAGFIPPLITLLTAFLIYLGFRIALRLISAIPIVGRTIKE